MGVLSRRIVAVLALQLLFAGCGSSDLGISGPGTVASTASFDDVSETTQPLTTTTAGELSSSSVSSTTLPSVTTSTLTPAPTTTIPTLESADGDRSQVPSDTAVLFGHSALDEPLFVTCHGDKGGARLLLVGSIHGDEDAGIAIVNELMERDIPAGVELWLVPTMNPDGNTLQQRHNANGVDLNRNFPHQWAPLAEPGNWQYAGPSAASEPETSAMVALGELVNPDLVLWYHQDLFRISPTGGRNGEIRALYAEISGLPLLQVSGGTYTGTASMWSRTVTTSEGTGFTVELGPSLTDDQLEAHVSAVLAVAEQFYASSS